MVFTASCTKESHQQPGTVASVPVKGHPNFSSVKRELPPVPETIHFEAVSKDGNGNVLKIASNLPEVNITLRDGRQGVAYLVRIKQENVPHPDGLPYVNCTDYVGWWFHPQFTNCLLYGVYTECDNGDWEWHHIENTGLDYCVWDNVGGIDVPGYLAMLKNFLKHGHFC